MEKNIEMEIDELYKFLEIDSKENERDKILVDTNNERTDDFFQKRWDSSFFANAMRY